MKAINSASLVWITATALVLPASTARAIEVYTAKPITPQHAEALAPPPKAVAIDPVTSRRVTVLHRHEIDPATSKQIDVVYSATIDPVTSKPLAVVYATRLDPTTGRPLDLYQPGESTKGKSSKQQIMSMQLDVHTGKPIAVVYSRNFDPLKGKPLDIVRTLPLPAKKTDSPAAPAPKPVAPPAIQPAPQQTPKPAPAPAPTPAPAAKTPPSRERLAGTWWCVAPSWSSGTIELKADGSYTRPGGMKGNYKIDGAKVIFDGPMQSWDQGRARYEGENLIFEWTNPDGGMNYFAFRKGT